MIVSRTPVRITLGGGGTDLPSYYSKHGGFLIAASINKYCTVVATQRFDNKIRLAYSNTETVTDSSQIKHNIFRVALQTHKIDQRIELHSLADVPANSGLGASSSFTVALLNALHAYKKDSVSHRQLAEEACRIEIDQLGEPIGKQDQYMASYGGLTCLTFEKSGEVIVEPLNIAHETLMDLEEQLLIFFTGRERKASDVLTEQDSRSREGDTEMLNNLHRVKEIGLQTRRCLEAGNLDTLGELFHTHWENKKKRSQIMTDSFIDESYEEGRRSGALGGKLVGAGGGGFLVFVCRNGDRRKLIDAMGRLGLAWQPFRFEFNGARVIMNTVDYTHSANHLAHQLPVKSH
jgi:D-glycero-alpha-D-manno-heptose-7-phosphate kinase